MIGYWLKGKHRLPESLLKKALSWLGSEPFKHEMDHGYFEASLRGAGQMLIILGKPSLPVEPAKRAFHDPAFGQNLEGPALTALDDFNRAPE